MKNFLSKSPLVLTAVFFSYSLLTIGCSSSKDKLEPAPGLTMEEPGTQVRLRLVVETTTGQKVANLSVYANSGNSSVRAITGDDGMVTIGLKTVSVNGVDFTFSGNEIEWTERVTEVPEEISSATLYFTVNHLGHVKFSRLHY